MQSLYFYFDDSGILHSTNAVGKFVYAGYAFRSKDDSDSAKRRYRTLVNRLHLALKRSDELKASTLTPKYKNKLFKVMGSADKLAVVVDIAKVYPSILRDTKSICRYKDFILKLLVKEQILQYLQDGLVSADEDIVLNINIDEQLTATDGIYGLAASVKEELQHGICNYNYGTFYEPIFNSNVDVNVRYWESKNNYMIQAADILANRIFASFRDDKPDLRKIKSLKLLTLPK